MLDTDHSGATRPFCSPKCAAIHTARLEHQTLLKSRSLKDGMD